MPKWPHFGRPMGIQRARFSLPEPLLGAPWHPRGPQGAPGDAQPPSREPNTPKLEPKTTQNHRKWHKIHENWSPRPFKIMETKLKIDVELRFESILGANIVHKAKGRQCPPKPRTVNNERRVLPALWASRGLGESQSRTPQSDHPLSRKFEWPWQTPATVHQQIH